MKLLTFLLLALCIASAGFAPLALAEQNFFIKKTLNRNVQEPEKPVPVSPIVPNSTTDQSVGQIQQPGMAPAPGRTPISNEQANSYYDNCLMQKSGSFTPQGQQMLCACTAAQMQKVLSVEDIQTMSTNTPEGQSLRDKMTLYVYAPCMKYPTHDLIYTRCMGDAQIKAAVPNPDALCKCMGDGMASFIEQRGPEQLMTALRQNPGDLDPLGTLMNSDAFTQQSQTVMQSCAGSVQ